MVHLHSDPEEAVTAVETLEVAVAVSAAVVALVEEISAVPAVVTVVVSDEAKHFPSVETAAPARLIPEHNDLTLCNNTSLRTKRLYPEGNCYLPDCLLTKRNGSRCSKPKRRE